MKFKRVFLIVLLGLITLTMLFTACSEDITSKKGEEKSREIEFEYQCYTYYFNGEDIEETFVVLNTKDELDAFYAKNRVRLEEGFLEVTAKYDDAFFENNLLIWADFGVANHAYRDVSVQSIEHFSDADSYVLTWMTKYGEPTEIPQEDVNMCFVIEVKEKAAITEDNLTLKSLVENPN